MRHIITWIPAIVLIALISFGIAVMFVRTRNYLEGSDVVYDPEKDVIRLAMKKKGRITLPEVVAETRMGREESQATLENLTRDGMFHRELTDTGAKVFVLSDMASFDEKNDSKKV